MRGERGMALLEVLVALAILASAGTGIAIAVGSGVRAAADARAKEEEFRRATALMTALTLRDRRGLDLRLGLRAEGGLITKVDRPRPGLYRLAVSDPVHPGDELLVTVVFRPGD